MDLVSQIHRAHNILRHQEDAIFAKHGLTAEQFLVLSTMKQLSIPIRITDIAQQTIRSVNSVSMLVDRMVKAGLIRRTRDKKDRRTVHIAMTSKAEALLGSATAAYQKFVETACAQLTHDMEANFIRLLGIISESAERKE